MEVEAPTASSLKQSDRLLYDAVFCYSNADQTQVKEIHDCLKRSGLNPWMDLNEVRAGDGWTEAFSIAIAHSNTAVVFFGQSGVGSRQKPEVHHIMEQRAKRGMRVIPIFLPGVLDFPEGAVLDTTIRAVTCANGVDDIVFLNDVYHGITGQNLIRRYGQFGIHLDVPTAEQTCLVALSEYCPEELLTLVSQAVQSVNGRVVYMHQKKDGFIQDLRDVVLSTQLVVAGHCPCPHCPEKSAPDPEVMYALGLARAMGKPTIVFTGDPNCFSPALPPKTRVVQYDVVQGEDGTQNTQDTAIAFQDKLGKELHDLHTNLRFPYLIDHTLENITVLYSDLIALRPVLWKKLQQVVSYGIDMQETFLPIHQLAVRVAESIDAVDLEIDQLGRTVAHSAAWKRFQELHKSFCELHKDLTEQLFPTLHKKALAVEQAYCILQRQATTRDVRRAISNSRREYDNGIWQWQCYEQCHGKVVTSVEINDIDHLERVGILVTQVSERSNAIELIHVAARAMIIRLLELIDTEHRTGGRNHANRNSFR